LDKHRPGEATQPKGQKTKLSLLQYGTAFEPSRAC